jgi:peptidoglycan/xylan/chitin deacetylase (PgdA/CDA1 family)
MIAIWIGISFLVGLFIVWWKPVFVVNLIAWWFPYVLFERHARMDQLNINAFALTIDDAPSIHTAKILDVLKKHKAKATFFVIGKKNIPSVLARVVREGHELGNHGLHHGAAWRLSANELEREIKDVNREIVYQDTYPKKIKWYRPACAVFTPTIIWVANRLGYKVALGSVYPHDPYIPHWYNTYTITWRVRRGSVVVLHDRAWTAKGLDAALTVLCGERGFQCCTLSKLCSL